MTHIPSPQSFQIKTTLHVYTVCPLFSELQYLNQKILLLPRSNVFTQGELQQHGVPVHPLFSKNFQKITAPSRSYIMLFYREATRQPLPAILKTTHQAMSVLPSFQSFQIKDIVICIGASAAWCVRP
jgi:hypothetical protein